MKPSLQTINIAIVLFVYAFVAGCHEHPVPAENGTVRFSISYEVDEEEVIFDSLNYTNAAGNQYSIQKLHYYLSSITLIRDDQTNYIDQGIYYVDARDPLTNEIVLTDVQIGEYKGISFFIGIPKDTNNTGYLPSTWENINMAWPDPMGGGYHFMKLEGYFLDSLFSAGYAIHIGTNECLVKVTIDHSFTVKYNTPAKQLTMNINEWFSNPTTFDLSEGNYTMGIRGKMLEIANNGNDVFTME